MTFLPEAFIQSPLFGIALTIVVYVIFEIIVDKFELSIIPPFVLACPMIIAFIYFQEPYITYEDYETGAGFINFLLGPATVALALPLYNNRRIIKENLPVIISGILVATITGIVSIFICGKMFGASSQVLLSMIPKSVTTPIAMDISSAIGGIPALTAACVIFTGMLGATFNHKILEALKIKNNIAIGLSIGASRHQRLRRQKCPAAGNRRRFHRAYRHSYFHFGSYSAAVYGKLILKFNTKYTQKTVLPFTAIPSFYFAGFVKFMPHSFMPRSYLLRFSGVTGTRFAICPA